MSWQRPTAPAAQQTPQRHLGLAFLLVAIGLETVALVACVVIVLFSTALSRQVLEGPTSLLMTVAPMMTLASLLVGTLSVLLVRKRPTSRTFLALHVGLPAAIAPALGFSGGTMNPAQLCVLAALSATAAIAGAVGAAALRGRRTGR